MSHWHDEPADAWVEPASLDPTPVWKQYLLVVALLVLALVLIVAVAVPAVLPQVLTPPAVAPGGRVVLPLSDLPAVGAMPRHIGEPLVSEEQAFWLTQPLAGEAVAVRARWSSDGGACEVIPLPPFTAPIWSFTGECDEAAGIEGAPVWGPRGEPIAAPRALDRYLVSIGADRLIVNVGREIEGYGATPQPPVSPLPTR